MNTKYKVQINQAYPLLKNTHPYKVEVWKKEAKESYYEYDYTMTKWGARQKAKRLIRKLAKGEFKPHVVSEYEVDS